MTGLEEFVGKFDDFSSWAPTKQTDFIAYYLTAAGGMSSVTGGDILAAFNTLHLKEYKRAGAYLSENAYDRRGKFVKANGGGYRLERGVFNGIDQLVKHEPVKIAVSIHLSELIAKVTDSSEKDFLEEAVNCYRIEAYRAFIIMVWIVTIEHLQKYVFANDLPAFNIALSKNPDKKMKRIVNYDDFSDLNEGKLIDLTRAAGIISNDVRKLLEEKLGTRNSAAHPSGIKVSGHKATEFAIDLIDNILLKYT